MPTGWNPTKRMLSEIRARAASGERVDEMAEAYGVSVSTLKRSKHTKEFFEQRGRPLKLFTDGERSYVAAAIAINRPLKEIAQTLSIDVKTLHVHFDDVIRKTRSMKLAAVGASLYREAQTGSVRAAETIMRNIGGWDSKSTVEVIEQPVASDREIEDAIKGLSKRGRDLLRAFAEEQRTSGASHPTH